MSAPIQIWRFEVGQPDHGRRLDGFLQARLTWRARSRLRSAIEDGRVEIVAHKDPQGAEIGRLRASLRLRAGQEVIVRLPAAQTEEGAGRRSIEPDAIQIVYEDDHLLAVNKPPHVNVYPTRRHRSGSLIELVHEQARENAGAGAPPSPCHRLDRETSGLVLFAKGRAARDGIQQQFEARTVDKRYLAVVVGDLTGRGRIDWPIDRSASSVVDLKVRASADGGGQTAVTCWIVRERLGGRTLVELRPETGRRHQLRAHLAALGHPIVGDKLYLGGDQVFLRSLEGELPSEELTRLGLGRQALHAWRLVLRHPATDQVLDLEAPLWIDLARLLDSSRSAAVGPPRTSPGRQTT